MKVLLANGADRNIRNNDGKSPLDLAVEGKKKDAIELLGGEVQNME